ncbi:alpha/beta fold hydrolase [Nonomuraea phyllanthi]|uniref:Alpha/beta fold hydrolase n=1 Tax=Nonomuraea phyllanthi TaxID=2219224 RepID=A0A5C4WK24_9ACTN|nr:alpha/beta hydrolase [Nonomuraea phyllanthi]KAB8194600.1 alpha/beta fold hydrolase [Nonomuraea phyllanthi]QFY09024.1 alpha/beta fold hydrolase [Nonomuraea phyllanthi]
MTIWHAEHGSGTPVVLLHSSAADSGMWQAQVEALSGRFRVITVDFRGYGRSAYRSDGPYSDAGDVTRLLADLKVDRAAVVGSSGASQAALELAAAGLADRLVLLNPVSTLEPTADVRAYWSEENRLLELGDVQGAAELNARTLLGPEATPEAFGRVVEMQRHAFEVQLAADPEPEQVEGEVSPAEIDVPALVAVGAHDLPYFVASARHLAGELPRARLVELEWAGHLPAMERPDEINRLLLDYL